MKNSLYLIAFVLALATAYAVSQAPVTTPGQLSSAAQTQPTGSNAQAPAATSTDDARLQADLQQQFAARNFTNVGVAVKDKVVTLTGSVPSKEDRKRAKELAKAAPGVKRVSEKLSINASAATAAPVTASPINTAGSIAGNTSAVNGTQAASPSARQSATSNDAGTSAGTNVSTTTAATTGATGGVSGAASTTTPGTAVNAQTSGTASLAAGAVSTNAQAGATVGTMAAGTTTGMATAGSTANGVSLSTAAENNDLQPKIENALKAEPTLSGSNVLVNVTGDTIELSGSAPSGKEKISAKRIAQSFAGNRKLVDHITVAGRGTVGSNPATPNSTTPPASNQTPPEANPKTQGDASEQPRF